MSTPETEPASFRDPSATVFYVDGRVLRGLDDDAARDWKALEATTFFRTFESDGRIIGTREIAATEPNASQFAAVLEHDRIPFVSYPYEWTFDMLRDAAVLHLEIVIAGLSEGISTKDGYAFNVQWNGSQPTFIDVGSFEQNRGGPWTGYRQFCRTFLNPLLLEAHLGIPFQRYFAGNLEGLEPSEMSALFAGTRRFKKGVFRHVYLHSLAERRTKQGSEAMRKELSSAGFSTELAKATVRNLLKVVKELRSARADSAWSAYQATCSYSDADRTVKERFLRSALDDRPPAELCWDLGANDGTYARIVAERGGYVVAVDADDVTVNATYRALRASGPANVLPLNMNLVDPSGPRGWRLRERKSFVDRGQPDLVLALALVHHLAIAANVPLPEIVDWFRSFNARLIVEFVEPHDPMAARLLANKKSGLFPNYNIAEFEHLLAEAFDIRATEQLPSKSRTLYLADPV